jgi:hypothetical protein
MTKPFRPLTHQESIAVLDSATHWLIGETKTMLDMPDGPCKERLYAELRARDRSLTRDFLRLVKDQE